MPKNADGIDNILFYFENESQSYRAGTDMVGKVVVHVDETTPIRGVLLTLFGRMKIYWKTVDGGGTQEFCEIEDYLDEKVEIWKANPRKKEDLWLFPGVHEYEFTYNLPIDLPESMDDSGYASINYTIKATVVMPNGRVSSSMEEPFYITAVPDPSVLKPSDEDLPKENCTYATIGGTCFRKKTHIELFMSLPRNVWKLGEKIPVHVECSVKGGSLEVDKVTVLLVQECIYTTDLDSKDEQRKKERLVMAEAIDKEDADVGECQNYDLELPIDEKMALTDFPWCDFIQMGYYVHAVARTHSFYDDIVVKLPIIIEPMDENNVPVSDSIEVAVSNMDLKETGNDNGSIAAVVVDSNASNEDEKDEENESGSDSEEDNDDDDEEEEEEDDDDDEDE